MFKLYLILLSFGILGFLFSLKLSITYNSIKNNMVDKYCKYLNFISIITIVSSILSIFIEIFAFKFDSVYCYTFIAIFNLTLSILASLSTFILILSFIIYILINKNNNFIYKIR